MEVEEPTNDRGTISLVAGTETRRPRLDARIIIIVIVTVAVIVDHRSIIFVVGWCGPLEHGLHKSVHRRLFFWAWESRNMTDKIVSRRSASGMELCVTVDCYPR